MKKRTWMTKLRKKKKWSQADLAKLVGVTTSTINHYENGLRTPKPATAKKIGMVLGFDHTEFYK